MSDAHWTIRDETPGDAGPVHEVETSAFGRPEEVRLVDALRGQVTPSLSLVADADGGIVGHAFFSPLRVESAEAPPVGGLAPIGVRPDYQGRGVGGDLIRAGLERAPALGWKAIFLLGDPAYYARFGFELAAPRGFHYLSEAFDASFQVIELEAGALAGCSGLVHYPAAFTEL